MLANSSMSSGSTFSPGLGRSSGSGASYSIDSGKWSATHCRTCTSPNWVRSKPSAEADTALSSCTYWFICCALASSMALKTPLIRSVTKRGNDTAFSTLRVMPAMRSALSPNPGCAACAVASGTAGLAVSRRSISPSAWPSSAISSAASVDTLTMACASARRCGGGSPW